jgi:hypothetical protein
MNSENTSTMNETQYISETMCRGCGKEIPANDDRLCCHCAYAGGMRRPEIVRQRFHAVEQPTMTPRRLSSDEARFADGALVPIYHPPALDRAHQLLEDLLDTGATLPDPGKTLLAIESWADSLAGERAAEALRMMAEKLDGTAGGVALRRVITGDKEPLRSAAKRAGVSHVALWLQERGIRKRLNLATP